MRKIRQGQTIYFIDHGYIYNPQRPRVLTIFLHSRKQELPLGGCVIAKWPVDYVRERINKIGSKGFYFSRRKAQTALNALKVRIAKQDGVRAI